MLRYRSTGLDFVSMNTVSREARGSGWKDQGMQPEAVEGLPPPLTKGSAIGRRRDAPFVGAAALVCGFAFSARNSRLLGLQAKRSNELEYDPAGVGAEHQERSGWKASWIVTGLAVVACLAFADHAAFAEDAAAVAEESSWFEPFVDFNAGIISGIDDLLEGGLGLPNSFGWAIIFYTVLIKALTFPLNEAAGRNSALMQMLQPKMKMMQRQYAGDQESYNRALMRLYDDAGVNIASGCISPLLQLPVFIGLYQAINKLAKDNSHFQEPFLWIPSLSGPAPTGEPSLDWLLKSQSATEWIPLVGWENAGLYLILPFAVITCQFIVSKLTQVQNPEGPGVVLQYLFPLVIGYATLVSPQGLALYWFMNNLLTGAQTVVIRNQLSEEYPQYSKVLSGEAEVPDVEEEPTRTYTPPSKGFAKPVIDVSDDDDLEAVGVPAVTTKKKGTNRRARRTRKNTRR